MLLDGPLVFESNTYVVAMLLVRRLLTDVTCHGVRSFQQLKGLCHMLTS